MKLLLLTLFISINGYSQKVLTPDEISKLMNNGNVQLPEGVFCFPPDFSFDFGNKSVLIEGVPGKTVITSYNGAATDFKPIPLDTNTPDNYEDGVYVVANHPYFEYGGGFGHLNLAGVYNTAGKDCLYLQGTILIKSGGVWSRKKGAKGFTTSGKMIVRDIIFSNCQFYLFSPFGMAMSDSFEISNCTFDNVSRVISSSLYGGIDHEPDWYNALNVYPATGKFRFKNFVIRNCTFKNIHTSIIWGFPPSEKTVITGNVIKDFSTILAPFNFYMQDYVNLNSFATSSTQLITGNRFENIITNHSFTTSLIRTSGIATVSNNKFINVTPQVCFFYGGNSKFINDTVIRPFTNPVPQVPVIIIKCPLPNTVNTFTGNYVDAPNSFFVSIEGSSSVVIKSNNLKVKTVYSKNNDAPGEKQYVSITDNTILSPSMSNVRGKFPGVFKSIEVSANRLTQLFSLHTGNTKINTYTFRNNILKECLISAVIVQAGKIIYRGNR